MAVERVAYETLRANPFANFLTCVFVDPHDCPHLARSHVVGSDEVALNSSPHEFGELGDHCVWQRMVELHPRDVLTLGDIFAADAAEPPEVVRFRLIRASHGTAAIDLANVASHRSCVVVMRRLLNAA